MKNILLLVGNGLTLDLISEFNLSINSSSPFSQKIPCLNPETFNILEYLPELNNYIKLKSTAAKKLQCFYLFKLRKYSFCAGVIL